MFSAVATVLAVLACVVGVIWAQHRASNGRIWSAQWLAFSCTAFGLLALVAGLIGYRLGRRNPFLSAAVWNDSVIWSQVGIGATMLAVAAVCWVIALRSYATPRAMGSRR